MSTDANSTSAQYRVGKAFHTALVNADWAGIRSLLHEDAVWVLPGDNAISGPAEGADAIVQRAQRIAGYGLAFELLHTLVSRENVTLSLHNTARRGDLVLDEYLSTVCRLRDGKVESIETYLSDVDGMNAFFV
ncbi:nuclear transport factor 2 family protein [Streptomyces sp. NPDC056411]|uniref:nuclear transport factor 2 family protein n=1 Tax=Streptomyces sp. NPDC056411 TaxID=3345813 RepID=UPI0035DB3ED8